MRVLSRACGSRVWCVRRDDMQQWHFASMMVWVFSVSISHCRGPHSCPLMLSLTANSSLLPRPAPHPALVHLRHPMGCAGLWPGTSVWVSLCPARQCLAAALFLEPPSFPSVPADGPAGEGLPQMRDPLLNFTLHQGCSPILLALVSLFLSFFFHPI